MFFHLYKYRLLKLIRTKELFFWSMIFPIFLGTLFYLCLGNFMNGFESFKVIPVAVVEENTVGEQAPFRTLLRKGDCFFPGTIHCHVGSDASYSVFRFGLADSFPGLDDSGRCRHSSAQRHAD